MQRKNAQSLGEVIQEFLKENNWNGKFQERRIIQCWRVLLGNNVAQYTTSIFIKNKILYVKISSSVLRGELQMCREMLIKRINEHIGEQVINNIIFS
ncbi:MAG: DUF721 domain-containing protein [Bacteroidota bacterium]|jgi:Zn-ribbon-containing, possibly RNA-binding protein and truncated derivatives|uniref:DciA family protein n=1 Tax=Parabacteroides sp. FAFU027 TaxID=2922715 RepID=UPI001FB038D6|nr:DUF721 domain-containing protein [Parabacteroides sp. FAFU027]MDP4270682.1 DUF721 domain-containing protein [Bacteroidota bacterium]